MNMSSSPPSTREPRSGGSGVGVRDVPRRASKRLAQWALGLAVASLAALTLPAYVFAPLFVVAFAVSLTAIRNVKQRPSEYSGAGFAWAGLGLLALPVVGAFLMLALRWAIVSPLPEGPVGDLRTFSSAMETYAAANGGLYEGRLRCLSAPAECLPHVSVEAPYFLGEEMTAQDTRNGYRFRFHAGRAAEKALIEESGASISSVTSWAYTAMPADTADGPAGRKFCVDSRHVLCSMPASSEMAILDGRCPASCEAF